MSAGLRPHRLLWHHAPVTTPQTTREPPGRSGRAPRPAPLVATLAWHPDVGRVGERMPLPAGRTAVGRKTPTFTTPAGAATRAIGDPFVSRRPAVFEVDPDGVTLHPGGSPLTVEGRAIEAPRRWSRAAIRAGLPVVIAGRVLLLIHPHRSVDRAVAHGLTGYSEAVERLRLDIDRAARLDVPVLLRGESGVGKELVARAVHAASARRGGPYRAVNVAAIPEAVAAAAFFGHRRGAFTGATDDRAGHFAETDGGTLFLDEIGDLAPRIQPMLLRALETGEIEPVGGRPRAVDVRVLAATDADLEADVRGGGFRRPLLHRLAGYVIRVPSLRERPDDIPRLLLHFLGAELGALDALHRLDGGADAEAPWLPADVIEPLMRYDWPGNVRELRNVARRIAAAGFDRVVVPLDAIRGGLSDGSDDAAPEPDPPSMPPRVETLDSETHAYTPGEVERLLAASGWSVRNAAGRIGVPKSTLLRYAKRNLGLRTAAAIPDAEWRACRDACGGDVDAIAARLRVSSRAARSRLKALDGG